VGIDNPIECCSCSECDNNDPYECCFGCHSTPRTAPGYTSGVILSEFPVQYPASTAFINRYWAQNFPIMIPKEATDRQYGEIVRFLNTSPIDSTDIPATNTSYRQLGGRHYWNILAGTPGQQWVGVWFDFWKNWAEEKCDCQNRLSNCIETGLNCPEEWNDWAMRLRRKRDYLKNYMSQLDETISKANTPKVGYGISYGINKIWGPIQVLSDDRPHSWPEVP